MREVLIRRRRGGNLLTVAMALLLILTTLLAAMHHYETISKRGLAGAEADLQLAQARKWKLATELGLLPAGASAPSLDVNSNLTKVASGADIPANSSAKLFDTDGSGTWNGLPNLIIERKDYTANGGDLATNPSPPSGFVEFAGKPSAKQAAVNVFHGKSLRAYVTTLPPYAAYAPQGTISLQKVVGWSNPKIMNNSIAKGKTQALNLNSGLPAVVAAGKSVNVESLPYGQAFCLDPPDNSKAVNITSGLAVPLVGRLPVRNFESDMGSNITTAMDTLSSRAHSRDDKTMFIGGEPISLQGLFKGEFDPLASLSLNTSMNFVFPTIPGFATAIPKGPVYCAFQFWFHAPFPPDGTGPDDLLKRLEPHRDRINAAQKKKEIIERKLQLLNGGVPRVTNNVGNSTVTNTTGQNMPQPGSTQAVDPRSGFDVDSRTGLRKRASSPQKLRQDLQDDLNYLQSQSGTALVTSGLKTDEQLLIWTADYGPNSELWKQENGSLDTNMTGWVGGVDPPAPPSPPPRPTPTLVMKNFTRQVPIYDKDGKITGYRTETYASPVPSPMPPIPPTDATLGEMISKKVVDKGKVEFPPLPSPSPPPPTTHAGSPVPSPPASAGSGNNFVDINAAKNRQTKRFFDNTELGNDSTNAISGSFWDKMLDVSFGEWKSGKGRLEQIAYYKFLLNSPYSPLAKLDALNARLETEKTAAETELTNANAAMEVELEKLVQEAKDSPATQVPKTRKDEKANPDLMDKNGIKGYAFSRYGYSFDMLFNLISDLASGGPEKVKDRWQANWPLVWYGPEDNILDTSIDATSNSFSVLGTFTVPSNRCFSYDHDLTIRGDLWLQRGSTMTVKGNLFIMAPGPAPSTALERFNYFTAVGRIVMEEGSTLIVDGNLQAAGTMEKGSVLLSSQPHAVHPINSAIICKKTITLPYGIYSGFTMLDILPELGSFGKSLNRDFFGPVLTYVFPNLGKLWGPFHNRNSFFCEKCPQYEIQIYIGPFFGLPPIPVMYPYPEPGRKNVWVSVYNALSWVYMFVDNFQLGENLYPQCDWWPFRHTNGCGNLPVLPKLDPVEVINTILNCSNPISDFPSSGDPAAIGDWLFKNIVKKWIETFISEKFVKQVVMKIVQDVILQICTQFLPSEVAGLVSPLLSDLISDLFDVGDEFNDGNLGDMLTAQLLKPFTDIKDKVVQWAQDLGEEALMNALAHEVNGVLVRGDEIKIGISTTGSVLSPAPWMATGYFMATKDLNINARNTFGMMISATGNINPPATGCKTNLLFYPSFASRMSLFMPSASRTTPIANSKGLGWMHYASAYEYGKLCPAGSAIDVGPVPRAPGMAPGVTKVMAEGWDQ